jgi:hypothetical protein
MADVMIAEQLATAQVPSTISYIGKVTRRTSLIILHTDNKLLDDFRRKNLQATFDRLLWTLRGFGALFPGRGTRKNKPAVVYAHLKFFLIICLLLFYAAEISFLFFQAIANLERKTNLEIHFISNFQFALLTAFGIMTFYMRSEKLHTLIYAVVRTGSWIGGADWFLVKFFRMITWSFLIYFGGSFIGILAWKSVAISSLSDSLFGLRVSAAVLSMAMAFALLLVIAFRIVHLSVMTLTGGILAIQFHRLAHLVEIEAESQAERSLEDALRQHWHLSKLVEDLNKVFSPSLLFFLVSDVAVMISLIGYLLGGSEMEAPLGLFITNSTSDNVAFIVYSLGATGMLLTRLVVAAFLHHQVRNSVLTP